MRRWQRYWFRAGGRTSAAVLRIAIGTSILWMLWRLRPGYAGDPDASPHELYRPVGILRLIPGEPGGTMLAVVWAIAWASTLAMIAGLFSRAATAVSFAAALVIASYEYSFAASWSHDNNAPLLAQLAFLGARGGDALSIDAWWRRRRGVELGEHAYLWSVQLVQLALGLMMASAAYTKLASGGFSLSWIFSDNLRNHILVRFDLNGIPRTEIANWLVDSPVRWKVAAALNVLAQLAPLAACFLTRRPILRAMFGALFALETIGLDLVMAFSNFHWLPLAVVFVDWDWLVVRLRKRPPEAERIVPVRRAIHAFVIAFLACDIVIAFWRWPKIDQKVGAYPLSAFPMFATIRARPPYSEHNLYEMLDNRLVVVSEPPVNAEVQNWIDGYLFAHELRSVRNPDSLRDELAAFTRELHATFPALAVRTVRAQLVAIQAPAYPAPARLDRVDVATLGEVAADGTFRCALGRVAGDGVAPGTVGLPAGRPAYYRDGAFTELAAGTEIPSKVYVVTRLVLPREGERVFVIGQR